MKKGKVSKEERSCIRRMIKPGELVEITYRKTYLYGEIFLITDVNARDETVTISREELRLEGIPLSWVEKLSDGAQDA